MVFFISTGHSVAGISFVSANGRVGQASEAGFVEVTRQ